MKFKNFQAPVLFSSTFKALNLGEKIQVLSRTLKDAWEPWVIWVSNNTVFATHSCALYVVLYLAAKGLDQTPKHRNDNQWK